MKCADENEGKVGDYKFEAKITGEKLNGFFIEKAEKYILLGGIPKSNEPDDGVPRNVKIQAEGLEITMKKGKGHHWTKFCEDCVLVFADKDKRAKVLAVFDGVSGNMDGSGGVASRSAAEILKEFLLEGQVGMDERRCKTLMEEYGNSCIKRIKKGLTTALVLFIFGNKKGVLFNKGDSLLFLDDVVVNETHGVGNYLTCWLNTPSKFDSYELELSGKTMKLCSDGVFAEDFDDVTVIEVLCV